MTWQWCLDHCVICIHSYVNIFTCACYWKDTIKLVWVVTLGGHHCFLSVDSIEIFLNMSPGSWWCSTLLGAGEEVSKASPVTSDPRGFCWRTEREPCAALLSHVFSCTAPNFSTTGVKESDRSGAQAQPPGSTPTLLLCLPSLLVHPLHHGISRAPPALQGQLWKTSCCRRAWERKIKEGKPRVKGETVQDAAERTVADAKLALLHRCICIYIC